LPDGRVDIFFTTSASPSFRIVLKGLESGLNKNTFASKTVIFAVSLKLLGVEYILEKPIADLIDGARVLPPGLWGVTLNDLNDFDSFCAKVCDVLLNAIPEHVDPRKQKLFDLVYESKGEATVAEISKTANWNARQINRYFRDWFGLSLKTYCNILRFRASFGHIKQGKLLLEQNYADQAHFIREVKKYSGTTPGELRKNEHDRFVQLFVLPKK
jgi:AraC-like DNA-binding protein